MKSPRELLVSKECCQTESPGKHNILEAKWAEEANNAIATTKETK